MTGSNTRIREVLRVLDGSSQGWHPQDAPYQPRPRETKLSNEVSTAGQTLSGGPGDGKNSGEDSSEETDEDEHFGINNRDRYLTRAVPQCDTSPFLKPFVGSNPAPGSSQSATSAHSITPSTPSAPPTRPGNHFGVQRPTPWFSPGSLCCHPTSRLTPTSDVSLGSTVAQAPPGMGRQPLPMFSPHVLPGLPPTPPPAIVRPIPIRVSSAQPSHNPNWNKLTRETGSFGVPPPAAPRYSPLQPLPSFLCPFPDSYLPPGSSRSTVLPMSSSCGSHGSTPVPAFPPSTSGDYQSLLDTTDSNWGSPRRGQLTPQAEPASWPGYGTAIESGCSSRGGGLCPPTVEHRRPRASS